MKASMMTPLMVSMMALLCVCKLNIYFDSLMFIMKGNLFESFDCFTNGFTMDL